MRWSVPLLGALLLAGCPAQPLPQVLAPPPPPPPVREPAPVLEWLALLAETQALTPAQAKARLTPLDPQARSLVLYRQVLLNQQLGEPAGWVWARDRLRQLLERDHPPGVRPLLQQLLDHNQALINADQREHNLHQRVQAVGEERDRLKEKIRALTNLERRLDDRKERGAEANGEP